MSLTKEQSDAHDRYDIAHVIIHKAVSKAYEAARHSLIESGLSVANDDRAEALVAAIMIYVEDSAV